MANHETQFIHKEFNSSNDIMDKIKTFKQLRDMQFLTDEGSREITVIENELISDIRSLTNDKSSTIGKRLVFWLLTIAGIIVALLAIISFFVFSIPGLIVVGIIAMIFGGQAITVKEKIAAIEGNRDIVERVFDKVAITDNHIVFKT